MSDKFKYDLNLSEFVLVDHDQTQLKEPLYQYVYKASEYRLGRYLMTQEELVEAYHHRALCRYPSSEIILGKEYLGVITGILASRGLWVVTLNDKVDIFRGQSTIRPVPS